MTNLEILDEADRKVALADAILVPNRRQEKAHRAFDYLRARAGYGDEGSTRGVLLVGPSQSGKSKILNSYRRLHNTQTARDEGQLPILMVTLKANQTTKGLAQNILVKFQDEMNIEASWETGNENQLLERVRAYIRSFGVKLLILDEFQHLVHSEKKDVASSVAETIKGFMNDGLVPVVMSGVEEAWRPIKANRQLKLRCIAPIELKRFDQHADDDWIELCEFLAGFQAEVQALNLIVDATSVLDVPNFAEKLFEASFGVVGELCHLLKDALHVAMCAGDTVLAEAHFAAAVDDKNRMEDGAINPFTKGLPSSRQRVAGH